MNSILDFPAHIKEHIENWEKIPKHSKEAVYDLLQTLGISINSSISDIDENHSSIESEQNKFLDEFNDSLRPNDLVEDAITTIMRKHSSSSMRAEAGSGTTKKINAKELGWNLNGLPQDTTVRKLLPLLHSGEYNSSEYIDVNVAIDVVALLQGYTEWKFLQFLKDVRKRLKNGINLLPNPSPQLPHDTKSAIHDKNILEHDNNAKDNKKIQFFHLDAKRFSSVGVPTLRQALIDEGFIKAQVTITQFRKIFTFEPPKKMTGTQPTIRWEGVADDERSSLLYLVKKLNTMKIFLGRKNNLTAAHCFLDRNDKQIDYKKFKELNPPELEATKVMVQRILDKTKPHLIAPKNLVRISKEK